MRSLVHLHHEDLVSQNSGDELKMLKFNIMREFTGNKIPTEAARVRSMTYILAIVILIGCALIWVKN